MLSLSLVILSPSLVILSPSLVILSKAKDPGISFSVNSAKDPGIFIPDAIQRSFVGRHCSLLRMTTWEDLDDIAEE